jgi:hypothetical protein
MADAEHCRRKAEALLIEASRATNLKERARYIDEAMHWHNLALDAHEHRGGRPNDNAHKDGHEADGQALK